MDIPQKAGKVAVKSRRTPKPKAWAFFSAEEGATWAAAVRSREIIFWYHGRMGSTPAYANQIAAGDSVLLVLGKQVIGTGLVLSETGDRYLDDSQRWRWPVLVVDAFPKPIPRSAFEGEVKLVSRQGAVHPLTNASTISAINILLNGAKTGGSKFPFPTKGYVEFLVESQRFLDALKEQSHILPSRMTAQRIGWDGPVFDTEDGAGEAAAEGVALGSAEALGGSAEPAAKTSQSPAPTATSTTTQPTTAQPTIDLVHDQPCETEDRLGRAPYALFLARRLHRLWMAQNVDATGEKPVLRAQSENTFILHVDAPWGGGKTTFANFIAEVLAPRIGKAIPERHFLREVFPEPEASATVFLGENYERGRKPMDGGPAPCDRHPQVDERPWLIARYNAWQDQYVKPPWWQVSNAIVQAIREALRAERAAADWREKPALRWRSWQVWWAIWRYKLGSSKVRSILFQQTALLVLLAVWLYGLGWWFAGSTPWHVGAVWEALKVHLSASGNTMANLPTYLGLLAAGGLAFPKLFEVIRQGIDPELDFSAESRQIGVSDPVGRFRVFFQRVIGLAERPVLLIVDDIDRCDPATVVEVMRGFQTILRSSRLFVLVLGDRNWIEKAHDIHLDKMTTISAGISGAEETLGSQFVRKMIQLSFRLPVMSREAKQGYTRHILGEKPAVAGPVTGAGMAGVTADEPQSFRQILDEFRKSLSDIRKDFSADIGKINQKRPQEETSAAEAKAVADLSPEAREALQPLLEHEVAVSAVIAASQQNNREAILAQALAGLFHAMPNNPRQMKRIVIAFSIYEQVGQLYYRYRYHAAAGEDEHLARRWRQLARWVMLATEWPETWRAIARWPEALDEALQPAADAATDDPRGRLLQRLREDTVLRAVVRDEEEEAGSSLDGAAVREFNWLMWEQGFPLAQAQAAPPIGPA